MSTLASVIWTTIVLGSTYGVMASGLTLMYGGLKFLNLAYGALYSVGAFAAYSAVVGLGVPVVFALPVGFAAGALVSLALHVCVFAPLLKGKRGDTTSLVGGLGASIAISGALVVWYGSRDRPLPALAASWDKITLPLGIVTSGDTLIIIAASVTTLLLLAYFLMRTGIGTAIRALANSRDGAEIAGVNTARLTLLVMVLGGGLGGLAGVLLSSLYFVSASSAFTVLTKALIVTVAGGLGSLRGTLLAAFAVALVEVGVSTWIGSQYSLPILFMVLLAFLSLRPQGLAGRISFEEGAS